MKPADHRQLGGTANVVLTCGHGVRLEFWFPFDAVTYTLAASQNNERFGKAGPFPQDRDS